MRERTLVLSGILILLLAFFSSTEDFTGDYIVTADGYGPNVPTYADTQPVESIYDVDGSGKGSRYERGVNHDDLIAMDHAISGQKSYPRADINGDGIIDTFDRDALIKFLQAQQELKDILVYGSECEPGEIICGGYGNTYHTCEYDPYSGRWVKSKDIVYCPQGQECSTKNYRLSDGTYHTVHSCTGRFYG